MSICYLPPPRLCLSKHKSYIAIKNNLEMLSDTDHKEVPFSLVFLYYKPNIWLFLIKSSLQAKSFLFF